MLAWKRHVEVSIHGDGCAKQRYAFYFFGEKALPPEMFNFSARQGTATALQYLFGSTRIDVFSKIKTLLFLLLDCIFILVVFVFVIVNWPTLVKLEIIMLTNGASQKLLVLLYSREFLLVLL
jgi:hypothetical protein